MTRARILADYVAGGSTAAEFDVLDGLTSTTAELNYVDGVTSNLQTQLDAKAPLADPDLTGLVQIATDANTEGLEIKSTGNTGQKITLDSNLSSAADNISFIQGKWDGTAVAAMNFVTGSDTTNKDDGLIAFGTAEAGTLIERMRIDPGGVIDFKNNGRVISGSGTSAAGGYTDLFHCGHTCSFVIMGFASGGTRMSGYTHIAVTYGSPNTSYGTSNANGIGFYYDNSGYKCKMYTTTATAFSWVAFGLFYSAYRL